MSPILHTLAHRLEAASRTGAQAGGIHPAIPGRCAAFGYSGAVRALWCERGDRYAVLQITTF